MSTSASPYNQDYFDRQQPVGEFGAWANAPFFQPHLAPGDTVLDFGCGGGFLLRALPCKKRIGVEINPHAAAAARENGLEVVADVSNLPKASIDAVITHHALEHVRYPLGDLLDLHAVLRPGGLIVCIVPCEAVSTRFRPDDPDHHLYGWSPQSLGNLFIEAGFHVESSRPLYHTWPPGYRHIARVGRARLFHLACRIYGHLAWTRFQIKLVARKPH